MTGVEANPTDTATKSHVSRKANSRLTVVSQASAMQSFMFEAAMALKRQLTNEQGELVVTREDAQAAVAFQKGWEGAVDTKRIAQNKPLPGSLKPTGKPAKASKRHSTDLPKPTPAPVKGQSSDEPNG